MACRISAIVAKPDTNERDGLLQNFIVTHVESFSYALKADLLCLFYTISILTLPTVMCVAAVFIKKCNF